MPLFLLVEVLFMVVVTIRVMSTAHNHEVHTKIVGSLCVVFGTIMHASQVSIMRLVVRTKSVKYMPVYLSLMGFLKGIDQTIYGFIHFDIFVVASSYFLYIHYLYNFYLIYTCFIWSNNNLKILLIFFSFLMLERWCR
ncbi:putative SWEET sugar transporter [Dioscorea sansibarensis]